MTGQQIIHELIRLGLNKGQIARRVGTSWSQVRLWERNVFKPSEANLERLKAILEAEKVVHRP
jgi:DNA-binding transcriptional regulator YiaG